MARWGVDWALPPGLRAAPHPEAARARTLVLFTLLALAVGAAALLHRLTDAAVAELSLVPVWVGLSVGVALLAALRAGLPIDLLAWVLIVSLDVLIVADALHWGGLRGAGIAGLACTPMLAAVLLRARAAPTVGAAALLVIVITTGLAPQFNPRSPELTEQGRLADAGVLAALVFGATALVTWHVREREHLEARLAREEARLAAAVSATHAAVFEWRPGHGVQAVNARFDALLPGVDPFVALDEEDRTDLVRRLDELAVGERHAVALHHRGADAVRARLHFDLLGVAGPDGPRVVGVVHDVTEAWRVATLRDEFVAVVGHELRTPLTSIRGALALLREVGGPRASDREEAHAQLMRIADENTRRLDRLIDDLLDVQALDAGTYTIRLEPVPLERCLLEVVEQSLDYAAACGTPVRVEGLVADVWLSADKRRLVQVLGKLVTNACKWSRRGAEVVLLAAVVGPRVRITVIDRGTGIPEAFRPHVFSRFAQAGTGPSRAASGAGLGLHIARAVTERMGGHIDFRSQPGVGSEFWVEFPAAPAVRA